MLAVTPEGLVPESRALMFDSKFCRVSVDCDLNGLAVYQDGPGDTESGRVVMKMRLRRVFQPAPCC